VREFIEAGGLSSYATSLVEQYRRVASYADKILKGAKPATCPWNTPPRSSWSSTPPTPPA
jgi:putative ABC transport system substrate-binding protein